MYCFASIAQSVEQAAVNRQVGCSSHPASASTSVAQEVEHGTFNPVVAGSIPAGRVGFANKYASVAQQVEQRFCKPQVPGSIPGAGFAKRFRDVAQSGSVRDLESRGRWFKSNHPDYFGPDMDSTGVQRPVLRAGDVVNSVRKRDNYNRQRQRDSAPRCSVEPSCWQVRLCRPARAPSKQDAADEPRRPSAKDQSRQSRSGRAVSRCRDYYKTDTLVDKLDEHTPDWGSIPHRSTTPTGKVGVTSPRHDTKRPWWRLP